MNMKGQIVARYGTQLRGHKDWLRYIDKDDQIAVVDNMMSEGEYGHLGGLVRAKTAWRTKNGRFAKNPSGQNTNWRKEIARFSIGQTFRIDDGDWGLSNVTIINIVTDHEKILSIYPCWPTPPMLVQFEIDPDKYPDDPPFVDELSAEGFISYIGDAKPVKVGGQNDYPVD